MRTQSLDEVTRSSREGAVESAYTNSRHRPVRSLQTGNCHGPLCSPRALHRRGRRPVLQRGTCLLAICVRIMHPQSTRAVLSVATLRVAPSNVATHRVFHTFFPFPRRGEQRTRVSHGFSSNHAPLPLQRPAVCILWVAAAPSLGTYASRLVRHCRPSSSSDGAAGIATGDLGPEGYCRLLKDAERHLRKPFRIFHSAWQLQSPCKRLVLDAKLAQS